LVAYFRIGLAQGWCKPTVIDTESKLMPPGRKTHGIDQILLPLRRYICALNEYRKIPERQEEKHLRRRVKRGIDALQLCEIDRNCSSEIVKVIREIARIRAVVEPEFVS
jgi:hypothetical protein